MGSLVLIALAFRSLSAERADFQGCSCRREDKLKRGKLSISCLLVSLERES